MSRVSLDTQFGFGTPTAFTLPVIVGFLLLIGGAVALVVIQRRAPTRRPPTPPPPYLPYPPAGAPSPHHQVPPMRQPGMWPPAPPHGQGSPKPPGKNGGTAQGLAIGSLVLGLLLILVRVDTDAAPPPGLAGNQIVIADTAGGLQRVQPPAAVVEDAEKRIRAGAQIKYAAYEHPKYLNAKPGDRVLSLIFYGVDGHGDPKVTVKNFFDDFVKRSGPFVSGVSEHPAGDLGGLLRCASVRTPGGIEVHCIWADDSTFGHLAAGDLSESEVAALLLRMRPDLEKPR